VAGGPLPTADCTLLEKFLRPDQIVEGHVESSTTSQFIAGLQNKEKAIKLAQAPSRRYTYHIDDAMYADLIEWAINEVGFEHLTIHLESMRSCPFNCSFCSIRATFPGGVQLRSLKDIEKELAFLSSLGIRNIAISDPTFGSVWKHAEEVLGLLSRHGMALGVMSRADVLTEERLRMMKDCGCTSIALGIETSDEEILEDVNKRATSDTNSEAIGMIKSAGIEPIALVILGLGELDDFPGITRFLYENGVNQVVATIYHPTPGSQAFAADMGRTQVTNVRDLEDFDFLGLPVLHWQDSAKLEAQRLAIRTAFRNPYDPRYEPDTGELKRILAMSPGEFEYAWLENGLVFRIGRHVYFYNPPGEYGEFRLQKLTDDGDNIETARQAMQEWKSDEDTRRESFEKLVNLHPALKKSRDIREEILSEGNAGDFQRRLRERANRETPAVRRLLLHPYRTL